MPEIDALRGIAALVVALVFHQYYLTGAYRTGPLDGLPVFTWLHDYGWTMVDLFFVLSGFIFSHVYLRKGTIKTSAHEFAVARFARLYPLHLATLFATAGILIWHIPDTDREIREAPSVWNFVLNLLMLHRSGLETDLSFNVPAWSIAVEVYCYVVFYIVARFFPRQLVWLSAVFVAVGFAITALEYGVQEHLARGLCGFFAGVLTFHFGARIPTPVLTVAATVPLFTLYEQDLVSDGSLLAVTAFPAWIVLARRMSLPKATPLQWLGDRSYSIYLVHAPVYWFLSIVMADGAKIPERFAPAALLIAAVAILLIADLSFRFLEGPARREIRSRASALLAGYKSPA